MLSVLIYMSTQPISEVTPVTNTISKTIEIDRTGPDMTPIAMTKIGISNLEPTISRPLSHRYDVVSLLSNWRLYKTWKIDVEDLVDISHTKEIWNSIVYSDLAKYVQLVRADLEILVKITSQAQQVGCVRAAIIPSYRMSDPNLSNDIHFPFTVSSVPFKLIPLGINSDHQFLIPWNSNVEYWNRPATGSAIRHGFLRLNVLVKHPIAEVPFTPFAQIFVRYVNVEFAGMVLNG